MNSNLGKTIRILRNAKELKLNSLAKDATISVSFLSLIENGDRQPSLHVLRRIAKALKVPSEALVLMAVSSEEEISTTNAEAATIVDSLQKLVEMEDRLKEVLANPRGTDEPEDNHSS